MSDNKQESNDLRLQFYFGIACILLIMFAKFVLGW